MILRASLGFCSLYFHVFTRCTGTEYQRTDIEVHYQYVMSDILTLCFSPVASNVFKCILNQSETLADIEVGICIE